MNIHDMRKILILLLLWILFFLAIRWHASLGLLPESGNRSIMVSFDYYGAFEEQVESLVLQIEEACAQVKGIREISSVSEPGKGSILCTFSDRTSLDSAYVQISDAANQAYAAFPKGVGRPEIIRDSPGSSPVFISFFPPEVEEKVDYIKKSYESMAGSGDVSVGGRKRKEVQLHLHSDVLSGMGLPADAVGSLLRRSNLVTKVAMPGGGAMVLENRISGVSDLERIGIAPGCRLLDVAQVDYCFSEAENFGHIDGRASLLFFVTKAGDVNALGLCRQLRKTTADMGGDVLYDQGREVENLIWFSAIALLFWISLLLFFLGFKAVWKLFFVISGSLAFLFLFHFQLDATGIAALFILPLLVSVSSRLSVLVSLGLILFLDFFYTTPEVMRWSIPFFIILFSGYGASLLFNFLTSGIVEKHVSNHSVWYLAPILLLLPFAFSYVSAAEGFSFSLQYDSGTPFSYIQQSTSEIEAELISWGEFDRIISHGGSGQTSFTIIGGQKADIVTKIEEIALQWPEIFFYIPEKHTSNAVDVTVYGDNILQIKNNVLELANYVNESIDKVKIVYNFKSDMANIVLKIPLKCAGLGLFPYDVYKSLYYAVSEPVVDKYFIDGVETDVKIMGYDKYRKSLAGLLAVPVLTEGGMVEAGTLVSVHKEYCQTRICHRNRMRCLSFSVTGASGGKLKNLVSSFHFTGGCYGEVH